MPSDGGSYGSVPAFRKSRAGKPGGFQGFPVRKPAAGQRINLPSDGARKSPGGNREGARYSGPEGISQWTPGQAKSPGRQMLYGGQTAPTVANEIGTALKIQPVKPPNSKGFGSYNPTVRGMFGGAVTQYIGGGTPGASYIKRQAGASAPSWRKPSPEATARRAARPNKTITYGNRSRSSR